MNLEEFVREALLQIIRGVASAGELAGDSGGAINPWRESGSSSKMTRTKDGFAQIQDIEFDVAVIASSESQAGGGAGIRVVSFLTIGGETKATTANQSESRVKFSVPVVFPANKH